MVMQQFFRAINFPEPEHCHYCGNAIRQGELIAEWSDSPLEYIHEGCADQLREDAQAAA
jgi:hypothetical protein